MPSISLASSDWAAVPLQIPSFTILAPSTIDRLLADHCVGMAGTLHNAFVASEFTVSKTHSFPQNSTRFLAISVWGAFKDEVTPDPVISYVHPPAKEHSNPVVLVGVPSGFVKAVALGSLIAMLMILAPVMNPSPGFVAVSLVGNPSANVAMASVPAVLTVAVKV